MIPFIGREKEFRLLQQLKQKTTASLVVLRGRRRIGKSRLVEEFSKCFEHSIEIQGLGPKDSHSGKTQLSHFAEILSLKLNKRKKYFESWTEALFELSNQTQKGEWLILLDEISWMADGDPYFPQRIKEAWDTQFKKNPKLILVLCGSVSSWIEDEIVKNQAFEGRISVDLTLEELKLPEIEKFWSYRKVRLGSFEKMLILSVTGGIPKYLEEVLSADSAEENLMRLCFHPTGFLFNEYSKIFGEIFQRRAKTMEALVRQCLLARLTPSQLAQKLRTPLNSDFSERLRILELAGFLSRDILFHFDGSPSKFSQIRVKDNYLRFYLKQIEPEKPRILKGGKIFSKLSDLKSYESVLGRQFENLILANRELLYPFLGLEFRNIVSAAPYFQSKTTKTKGACQVDLLVQSDLDVFFLCEMKCKRTLDLSVVREIQRKMDVIKLPKRSSLKPVLIYEGEILEQYQERYEEFFHRIVPFSKILG